MKFNKWTLGLAAVGVVSLTSAARADETKVSQLNTALSNTTISGYVDVSAQFTPQSGGTPAGGTAPNNAPNYYYGNTPNSINMNVVDIAIDKPMDESPWASGYHVEFWVGPAGQALGVGNDIRQAYISLRTPVGNGIDWKVGTFDTIVGYESTTTLNNPNYSHSYGYNMEPTTHTGILGAYKFTDMISAQAGLADTAYQGSGVYTAAENTGLLRPTVMGSVTLTAPDNFGWAKGATATAAIINTSGSTTGGSTGNGDGATTYYFGATLPTPMAALTTGASFDYLEARDVSGNEWDLAVYGSYKFNDKLSLNLRAEYFEGSPLANSGAYGVINPAGLPVGPNGIVPPYPSNDAQEITATLQYALWANVLTRLELRWDHSNNTSYGYTTPSGGNQQNAFMLAAQAVYQF